MPHVTIPDSRAEIVYGSVTGTGPLNFTFAYLAKDDLKVRVNGALLASNAWSVAPSQTVSGGFIGGNITLNAAVTAAEVIITRETEPGRTTDFAAGGAKPDQINTDLDRVHAILRDLKTLVIERGFRLPAGDNSGPLILGDAATRAETVIAFDENGDLDPVSRVNVDIVAGIAQNIIDLSEPLVVTAIQSLSAAEVIAALLILDDVPAEVVAVAAILDEIIALDAVATEIGALGAITAEIVAVEAIIADIITAAANDANITIVATDLALGPSSSFILRAPQAALDAQAAAAATVGLAQAASDDADAAAQSALDADASSDSSLSHAAAAALAAATAVQTVFLPYFISKSRSVSAQPGAPANLDTYILGPAPSGAAWGAWAEGDVVRYFNDGSGWVRVVPVEGSRSYVLDEAGDVQYASSVWGSVDVAGIGVSLTKLGMTPARGLAQAVYEANNTIFDTWRLTSRISFLEDMIGFWTPINPRDSFKAWASGFAAFVAPTTQNEKRANAAGFFYAGGATSDPFIWHLESAKGVQPGTVVLTFDPTGSELSVAGDYINKANTFVEGEYVTYSNGGGASIGGLTSGNGYFIKDKGLGGANRFKLAATRGGASIDFSAGATGTTHTLTQADTNLEGTDLRGLMFDGGLAGYTYVSGRNGYGNSVDLCAFTGGTIACVALLNSFGLAWGRNFITRCPNIGLSLGWNLFNFTTGTEQVAFAVEGKFSVTYTGHDSTGTKIVDYTVVRGVLTAPDGTEDDEPYEDKKYLVASAGASGAFAGQENKIATYDRSATTWSFVTKANGAIVYDVVSNICYLTNGTTWSADATKITAGAGVVDVSTRTGPGQLVFTTIERCAGWGYIYGAVAPNGPSNPVIGYMERNAGGVLIPYNSDARAPKLTLGFNHPGGTTQADQIICIRGQDTAANFDDYDWLEGCAVLADAGPADDRHWLRIEGGHGVVDVGGESFSIYSNTGKYFVDLPDANVFYGNKVPYNYVDPSQVIVYVNNTTGHDAYPGTSAKPLKTGAEAIRRCKLNKNIVTIEFVGDHNLVVLDVGGTQQTEITVQGSGTARLLQAGTSGAYGLTIKGKGARILVSDTFTKVENVDIDGASVKYLSDITSANTGSTNYALRVQNTHEAYFEATAINANGQRGIRPVNAKLYLLTCTLTNYGAGLSVVCDRGAFLECNYLNTDSAALDFLPTNAAQGASVEGFITFKDGKKFSYESNAYVSSGLTVTSGSTTAYLLGSATDASGARNKTFDGATAVAPATDQITLTAHGVTTGEPCFYNNGGGTTIPGLTNDTNYFAIVVDANTIKLATNGPNAAAGTAIDITADGAGASHRLTFYTGNTGTLTWREFGGKYEGFFDLNTTTFDGDGELSVALGNLPVAAFRQIVPEIQNWRIAGTYAAGGTPPSTATGGAFQIYGMIENASNVMTLYKEYLYDTTDVSAQKLTALDLSGADESWDVRIVANVNYWTV